MSLLGGLVVVSALAAWVLAALLVPADLRAWRSGPRVAAACSLVLKALAAALVLGSLAWLTPAPGEAPAVLAVLGIEASAVLVPALVLDAALLLRSRQQD